MEILKLIKLLEIYEKEGSMNIYEIEKIKNALIAFQTNRMKKEIEKYTERFLDEMMKRITVDYEIYHYANENKEVCSKLINSSIRTLYRKLENESLTNKEKEIIKKAMMDDR